MVQINPFDFVPEEIRKLILDSAVDFVSEQAKKIAGDTVATKIKLLRSDGAFQKKLQAGLDRAVQRFLAEYEKVDEDLVAAIIADKVFFQNQSIRKALLKIVQQPSSFLEDEKGMVWDEFESVLPFRKNRERVQKAISFLLECLAKELWHLPELQPAYSLQYQRLSVDAMRQQIELQKLQLNAINDLGNGVRDALLQFADAIEQQKQLPAPTTVQSPNRVLHNLPQPDYGQFIGRESEIAKIHQLLRPYPHSQHSLITIDGIGGIGKSTLALEVAYHYLRNVFQLPKEECFDAIIWISAKQSILTADGIQQRSRVLKTRDDIYTAIGITLQREDITRASSEEQPDLVQSALAQQRTLLIIDNLETVDDESVITFLRELPAPTKSIVTTRHRIDVAYSIRLTGMEWGDGCKLIESECRKKDVMLSNENSKKLFERTGGVPLAIVWSIAMVGFGYSISSVLEKLGQPTSDIARFSFGEIGKSLHGKPSYKILMALSLFQDHASRVALKYVTKLPVLDVDEGLVDLEKLSLINKREDRFYILPLTGIYIKDELSKDVELEKELVQQWIAYYRNFLSSQRTHKYQSLGDIKPEIQNILKVMDWCWNNRDLDNYLSITEDIEYYLWSSGNWNAWETTLRSGIIAASVLEDEVAQARFLNFQSSLCSERELLAEAEQYAMQALNIYRKHNNESGIIESLSKIGTVHYWRNDLEKAHQSLSDALDGARRIGYTRQIVRVQRNLALIDMAQHRLGVAEERLLESKALREEETPISAGLAYTNRLLTRLELLRNNVTAAEKYVQISLNMAREVGSALDIASAQRWMAEIELAKGHTDTARELAKQALVVFVDSGVKRSIAHTQDLLNRINKDQPHN